MTDYGKITDFKLRLFKFKILGAILKLGAGVTLTTAGPIVRCTYLLVSFIEPGLSVYPDRFFLPYNFICTFIFLKSLLNGNIPIALKVTNKSGRAKIRLSKQMLKKGKHVLLSQFQNRLNSYFEDSHVTSSLIIARKGRKDGYVKFK